MNREKTNGVQTIIYVQFTNPAGYPPLHHSAKMFAERGWTVLFLGIHSDGSKSLRIPTHALVSVRYFARRRFYLSSSIYYAAYCIWVLAIMLKHRPAVVYGSDIAATPILLLTQSIFLADIVYHEHDTPRRPRHGKFGALFLSRCHARVARTAQFCVIPQSKRRKIFVKKFNRSLPTFCVWNCPSVYEVSGARSHNIASAAIRFYYHGNISAQLLPATIIEALALCGDNAELVFVGYETSDGRGHVAHLLNVAKALGIESQVFYLGILQRAELLVEARKADVGVMFVDTNSRDANMINLAGASNKVFDYMASGQMVLTTSEAEWRSFLVDPGYAITCRSLRVSDIAQSMRWCSDNRETVRKMGERGRAKIMADWNYETQFSELFFILCERHGNGAGV